MPSQTQSGELHFLSALGISPAAATATLNGGAAVAASKAVTKNRQEKTVEKAEVVQAAQTVLMGCALLGECGIHNILFVGERSTTNNWWGVIGMYNYDESDLLLQFSPVWGP
jgi:hypothetical protein